MIVYFHGLESKQGGDKQLLLEYIYGKDAVYAPQMDYRSYDIFNETYNAIKRMDVKLFVGSSMGGYFAYWMAQKMRTQSILLNPALAYRNSINPEVDTKVKLKYSAHAILGRQDEVIPYEDTLKWLKENHQGEYTVDVEEEVGHRTSADVLEKYLLKYFS